MSQPFIGEIRLVAFNFAPVNWAFCDGSVVQISQNEALYNLIGTTYGGNGTTNFFLPNLLGRIPVHQGNVQGATFVIGQSAGTEAVQLTTGQLPTHTHAAMAASGGGTSNSPAGNTWTGWTGAQYVTATANGNVPMSPQALSMTGGNVAHDNVMPFMAVNFIISLFGVYPSQG